MESPQLTVSCSNWRPYVRNTLKGFACFELPDVGISIRDCPVHQRETKTWVSMPGRSYEDDDGNRQWANVIDWTPAAKRAFQQAAKRALADRINADGGGEGQ